MRTLILWVIFLIPPIVIILGSIKTIKSKLSIILKGGILGGTIGFFITWIDYDFFMSIGGASASIDSFIGEILHFPLPFITIIVGVIIGLIIGSIGESVKNKK